MHLGHRLHDPNDFDALEKTMQILQDGLVLFGGAHR